MRLHLTANSLLTHFSSLLYNNPMTNLQRKLAFFNILATAWLALAVIFAGVFVIAEHDHVHVDVKGHRVPTGENCHICFEIQIALRLIEAFGRLGISIALIGFMVYGLSFVKLQTVFNPFNSIPVKVKFNC
jgi:predicted transporter